MPSGSSADADRPPDPPVRCELAAIWAAITRCELAGTITMWAAGILRCIMLTGARARELAGDRQHFDMGAHWDRLEPDLRRLTIVDHKGSRLRSPKVIELPAEAVVEMQRMAGRTRSRPTSS